MTGRFPTIATGEPPLVMRRCGRFLFAKSRTSSFRPYSTVPPLSTPEPTASATKPNALTLIHKTSSLLPSVLSPAPKHSVESLKLWTNLLDYAHNASIARKYPVDGENWRARIVGAFIPRSFSALSVPTSDFLPPVQCMGYAQALTHLLS